MARNLNKGVTGQDVRVLQDRLNYHLRRETPLNRDGIFGPLTHSRVVKFQTVNSLKPDGIVGRNTRALLFAADVTTAQVLVVPNLTMPTFGAPADRHSISPPQLIPPLVFDPFPKPVPQAPQLVLPSPVQFGPQFQMKPLGSLVFQPIDKPSLMNVTLTATPVQDPTDPGVQATKNLVKIIQDVPIDSKFRGMIISAIPKPISIIKEPDTGFDHDIGIPKYNPLDPNKIQLSGGAKYTMRLFGQPKSALPQVFLRGAAEGEFEIKYDGQARGNYFKASADVKFFLGFIGVF